MMNQARFLLGFTLTALLTLSGCGGSGGGSSEVIVPSPRTVEFSVPYAGATNVALDTDVTIAWDDVIDCSTVSASTISSNSPGWSLQFCGGNKAIFTASAQAAVTSYSVNITSGVKDPQGRPLNAATINYTTASAPPVWGGTVQFGTGGADDALYSAVDSAGNIFLVGDTLGVLEGTNEGSFDAYVEKIAADGTSQPNFLNQFGTLGEDLAFGVAVDGGDIYVAGSTDGDFLDNFPAQVISSSNAAGGFPDAYLAKLNGSTGDLVWIHQFGTDFIDVASAVAVDGVGNIYVSGFTDGVFGTADAANSTDAFVAKFDSNGAFSWLDAGSNPFIHQFGADIYHDDALSLEVGADGFVYVAGETGLFDTDGDPFVAKINPADGVEVDFWAFGDSAIWDYANSLQVYPNGDLYVAGKTILSFGDRTDSLFPNSRAFLAKLDGVSEIPTWLRTLESVDEDEAFAVALDGAGYIYVAGFANGDLNIEGGASLVPNNAFTVKPDGFLAQYLPDGTPNWVDYIGDQTAGSESANHVVAGVDGEIYVVGRTSGNLIDNDGISLGGSDAYLVRYTQDGEREPLP